MKEDILEILKTELHSMAGHTWLVGMDIEDCKTAAKEITAHITEFVSWKDFGNHPFVPWFDLIDGEIEKFYTDEVSDKRWTLMELYQDWKDNIKDK